MKRTLIILFLIYTFPGHFLYSQTAPDTLWTQHFGDIHEESSTCIRQTSDGNFIIIGVTDQTSSGRNDIWLIKADENGIMIWDRTFGGNQNDFSIVGHQTADGGFIIAGTTESFGNGMQDFWLIKTDADGNEEWNQTFGTAENDRTQYVKQTFDGGYIITGGTGNFETSNQDAWLIKTDENGNLEWQQTYGGNGNEKMYTVHQETDGSYILAGLTSSYGNGTYDAYLIKTDSLGNEIWSQTFGGSEIENAYSMQILPGEGYILAGSTKSFGAGDFDVWLIKTDQQGNEIWSYVYGTEVLEYCYSLDITSDGNFILGGLTNATVNGDIDVLVMKISDSGDEIWTKKVGLDGDEPSFFVEQSEDEGYVLAGYSNSFGNGDNDVYIVKLAPDGSTDTENIIDQPSGHKLWNYPNPFNPSTEIKFQISDYSTIKHHKLSIYNLRGQIIKQYLIQDPQSSVTWNGKNEYNIPVSSGIYFCRLNIPESPIKKMVLLK